MLGRWRAIILGGIGWCLGYALASLFVSIIFRSFIADFFTNSLTHEQFLLRFSLNIIFILLVFFISGVLGGAVGAKFLSNFIDYKKPKEFILKNTITTGFTLSVLFVPFLFLTSIVAFYTDANAGDLSKFLILFGFYGVVFGVVFGIVISIALAKMRAVFKLLLASIMGFALGGMAFGCVVYLYTTGELSWLTQRIALTLAFGVLGLFGGGALGFVFHNPHKIIRNKSLRSEIALIPYKFRLIVGICVVGLSVFIFGQFMSKLIVRPATNSLVINSSAENYSDFDCDPNLLNHSAKAVYDVVNSSRFNPDKKNIVFCGNKFDKFVFMPNPDRDYSDQEPYPNGGFDEVANLIKNAKREVLFVTMQWDEDKNQDSPGRVYANAVNDLYENLKENKQMYPNGIDVKILTGNMPVLAAFETGDQSWHVLNDLRTVGLESMVDENLGWSVEVANYDGAWPHNHSKFVVVDGQTVLAAGFNYSYLHYPRLHSSGVGINKYDLGLQITGPVAQYALAVFDDLWDGSTQRVCDLSVKSDLFWGLRCDTTIAKVASRTGENFHNIDQNGSNAFALFRSESYQLADAALEAALRSSNEKIDIMEVNFSLETVCELAIVYSGICNFEQNALPFMRAIIDVIEQKNVKVRLIVEKSNMNGLENEVALKVFFDELQKRNILNQVEVRLFEGNMHTKSFSVDDQLLFVGSHNFHYSAWGDNGLTEFSLATDSPEALEEYNKLFEYHWERAIPINPASEDLIENKSS